MMFNNKKAINKWVYIYLVGVLVIAIALAFVVTMQKNYVETDMEVLKEQYDIDESLGQRLVQCVDGGYDVYTLSSVNNGSTGNEFFNTTVKLEYLCGQVLTMQTKAQLEAAYR